VVVEACAVEAEAEPFTLVEAADPLLRLFQLVREFLPLLHRSGR